MIAFKDFAPRVTDKGGMFTDATFETVAEAVDAASRWCDKNGVVPLNVETVVLPDIYNKHQEGPQDAHVTTGNLVEWYQIVRVWYLAK